MTQRFVPGAGKSAIVSGLPSGPITYFARGRRGSFMNRTHALDRPTFAPNYWVRLKIYLSTSYQMGNSARNWTRARSRHDAGWELKSMIGLPPGRSDHSILVTECF